jgi:hypothetical protein
MTDREILDRIIGRAATIADIVAAFSGTHPELSAYTWTATAEVRGEIIGIEGVILESGRGNGARKLTPFRRSGTDPQGGQF